ncbi:MAG: P-loop containing nucleoside triphosphate hydrolase protein [Benniella sp.]|nr:MAG: P-loop containing nucleoside triphosphate hydrolase protein [Benniella sp.]
MASGTGIKPREYQTECVHSCLDSFMKGVNRMLVSLPTGSGKTVIFTLLLEEVPSPFPGATKTLILVNRELQITQVHKYISNCGSKLTVSVDQGKQYPDMDHDVIVASVQSLARDPSRLLKYNPKQFKCIITDEAHHATSASYAKILQHFRVHEKNKSHILLAGFTATAWRHDGVALNTVFDKIVFHRNFMEMIEGQWLCPLRIETVNTGTDLADVDKTGKDFQKEKLFEKINTPERNASVVNAYRAHCGYRRKATVVFAADVKHSVAITERFIKEGYDAHCITNYTNAKERARLLQDFRDGKFSILVNCEMMTEGADFPMIDAIIIARPTKSTVLMVQMLGRGVRLHPGKVDCLILDMVDTVDRKVFSIIPVLLGLDPKVSSSIITSKLKLQSIMTGTRRNPNNCLWSYYVL